MIRSLSEIGRFSLPVLTRTSSSLFKPLFFRSVSVLSYAKQDDAMTTVMARDRWGFRVNDVWMRGSVLVFSRFTLLWNVQHVVQISPRNLAAVHIINPKVEILIIGTGETQQNINPSVSGYFSRRGISVIVMDNSRAISTFNVLQNEGRRVCVALLSRSPMSRADASLYTNDYKNVTTEKEWELLKTLAEDVLPQDRPLLLAEKTGDEAVSVGFVKEKLMVKPKENPLSAVSEDKSQKIDKWTDIFSKPPQASPPSYGVSDAVVEDISPIAHIPLEKRVHAESDGLGPTRIRRSLMKEEPFRNK